MNVRGVMTYMVEIIWAVLRLSINITGGSNARYYILKEHLGSASVVIDASGNIVGEDRYYPYGETRFSSGSMYTDKLFTGQREIVA